MDVPYTIYIFTSTTPARFTKLIILKGFLQTYNKETISLNKEILCLFGVLIFVLKPFFMTWQNWILDFLETNRNMFWEIRRAIWQMQNREQMELCYS